MVHLGGLSVNELTMSVLRFLLNMTTSDTFGIRQ
jgi:hypothetical protein